MATADHSNPNLPFYKDIDGYRLPGFFSEAAYRSALAYKPRHDDLFIVTFPKSGTTWVQSIVAWIYRGGRPFTSALEFLTFSPFLEMAGAGAAENMKRPGAIKCHFPFHMTPWSPQAKYIFVARNPKDVCVSFYHHTQNIVGYNFQDGKFGHYFDIFVEGKGDFGDYFDTLLSWYEHRNDPNVLFIAYEQLKQDNKKYVLKIAEFLGSQFKKVLEDNQQMLNDVIYHTSVSFLKNSMNKHFADLASLPKYTILNDPDIPQGLKDIFGSEGKTFNKNFSKIRKGIVGDWRSHFTPEQSRRLDKKFQERVKGTELEDLWRDCMS